MHALNWPVGTFVTPLYLDDVSAGAGAFSSGKLRCRFPPTSRAFERARRLDLGPEHADVVRVDFDDDLGPPVAVPAVDAAVAPPRACGSRVSKS
jgi:hypothetical protein